MWFFPCLLLVNVHILESKNTKKRSCIRYNLHFTKCIKFPKYILFKEILTIIKMLNGLQYIQYTYFCWVVNPLLGVYICWAYVIFTQQFTILFLYCNVCIIFGYFSCSAIYYCIIEHNFCTAIYYSRQYFPALQCIIIGNSFRHSMCYNLPFFQ